MLTIVWQLRGKERGNRVEMALGKAIIVVVKAQDKLLLAAMQQLFKRRVKSPLIMRYELIRQN